MFVFMFLDSDDKWLCYGLFGIVFKFLQRNFYKRLWWVYRVRGIKAEIIRVLAGQLAKLAAMADVSSFFNPLPVWASYTILSTPLMVLRTMEILTIRGCDEYEQVWLKLWTSVFLERQIVRFAATVDVHFFQFLCSDMSLIPCFNL